MKFQNSIIYLLGFAGVGKRTIGLEICNQANFRLIDNHTINNVVFPFVRMDGHTKMPQQVWDKTRQIRKIALDTMIEIGNREFNFIFTNQLVEKNLVDFEIYECIEYAAEKMNACFMPVRLICNAEENKKRIINLDRDHYFKVTRSSYVDEMQNRDILFLSHKNAFTLDISDLNANEAASRILQEFKAIYKT